MVEIAGKLNHRPSLAPSIISFGQVVTSQRIQATRASLASSTQEQDLNLELEKLGCKRQHINKCFHQYRFVIAQLSGMAAGLMLFHRYSMSIAILPMVNQTRLYLEEHPNNTLQDFLDEGFVPGDGEFNWNNEIVAIILGWYMFSYTLPQTLAAKWNVTIGCRLSVPIGLSLCSISSLLTPSFAYLGWQWVVACRLLNGFGGAGILPGMLTLIEDWLRYDELSSGLTMGTFVFALVVALCPLVSGYLAAIHWSVVFYAPACVTLMFNIIWLVLVTDKAQTNWLVSERELKYLNDREKRNDLEKSEDCAENGGEDEPDDGLDFKPDSWLQIFKLPAFYAYLVVWIIDCISSSAFTFILPLYMQQFLKIPIAENGFYCAIIQMGFLVAVLWPHQVLGLLAKINLTITQARLISQALCTLVMAGTFAYVGVYHQHQLLMFFLNRCALSGDIIMTGSVMSNFAKAGLSSLFFAVINTIGNLSLTGASPLIGRWLDYTSSSEWGWKMVFYALGLSQVVLFFIFWLFIDSEPIRFKNKSRKEPAKVAQ